MGDFTFNPDLACIIGVDEAIMINNLVFWIKKNKANHRHFYNERYWTYNSVAAFKELFPFWTDKQLRRIMESLVSQNVIVKGNFNKNSFDRTGWYSISDTYLYLLGSNGLPISANGLAEKDNTIPDSKPDSNYSLFDNKELNVAFTERCSRFIKQFNNIRGTKYQATSQVKTALKLRLKTYKPEEIIKALNIAILDKKHIDDNFKYLTPEFILREYILERYLNQINPSDQTEYTGEIPQKQGAQL